MTKLLNIEDRLRMFSSYHISQYSKYNITEDVSDVSCFKREYEAFVLSRLKKEESNARSGIVSFAEHKFSIDDITWMQENHKHFIKDTPNENLAEVGYLSEVGFVCCMVYSKDGEEIIVGHSTGFIQKQRITSQQRRLMLDFVKQCPPLATKKFSGPNGALLRDKYLIKMSNSLNSVGFGPKKTLEKWLRSWLDWKSDVKGKASAIARYQQGSGGGPPPTPLSPIEDELIRFIGTEVVTGMEGVPETLSIPNTPPDTDTIDETPSSRDQESVPSPSRGEQQHSATTATSNPRAIPEPPQKRKKVEKEATESDNIAAAMLSQSQALDNVAHQMGRMADSMSLMSNVYLLG